MKKVFVFIGLFLLLAILLTACSSNSSTSASPTTTSSSGQTGSAVADGKTLLETRCVSCHTLAKVVSQKADANRWQMIVNDMVNRGAVLTAEEQTVLVQYLAANFK